MEPLISLTLYMLMLLAPLLFYPPSLIAVLICRSTCYLSLHYWPLLLTLVATSPYLWPLITFVSISRYRVPLDLDDSSHIALLLIPRYSIAYGTR